MKNALTVEALVISCRRIRIIKFHGDEDKLQFVRKNRYRFGIQAHHIKSIEKMPKMASRC